VGHVYEEQRSAGGNAEGRISADEELAGAAQMKRAGAEVRIFSLA
jgi:hypothetical protein